MQEHPEGFANSIKADETPSIPLGTAPALAGGKSQTTGLRHPGTKLIQRDTAGPGRWVSPFLLVLVTGCEVLEAVLAELCFEQ